MTNNPTATQFWENLYHSTQSLTQANSAHQMFTDQDILELDELVKGVFIKFLKRGELHQGIKVYVNRELDNSIVHEMAGRPPKPDESIEEWCKVIFGERRFGVVFNSLESYSNELAEKMATIITPLLKKAGIPLGGLSFLFFMGNYGFTPFGIHKEAKGEEGFLFHLGPADKKFYTWDNEELNKIEHNAKVFHEVDDMLPAAKFYQLHPKSVMFIPNHLYHIGNTQEFSLSVVMDYINPSISFLENTIAQEIAEQEVTISSDHKYVNPIPYEDNHTNWNDLLDLPSWESKYKHALERRIQRLRSNCGVLKKAIVEIGKVFPSQEFEVAGKTSFPLIEFIDQNSQTYILARGHEIPVNSSPKLSNILSLLNEGKKLNMKDIQDKLKPEWDLVDIFSTIDNLYKISAIEICM
jgi:hypothetical protein